VPRHARRLARESEPSVNGPARADELPRRWHRRIGSAISRVRRRHRAAQPVALTLRNAATHQRRRHGRGVAGSR
jgi:hypothetical protein